MATTTTLHSSRIESRQTNKRRQYHDLAPAVLLGGTAFVLLLVFLIEMLTYREAGTSIHRMAVTIWMVSYLGLLPSFLTQLRWLPGQFAKVRAALETKQNAVVVPQRAVQEVQGTYQVAVVGDGDTVSIRKVKTGMKVDNEWVIDEGLAVPFDGDDRRPDGVPGHHRVSQRRARERHGGPGPEADGDAVGQAGSGVLLVDHRRDAAEAGGHQAGQRGVPADPDDDLGPARHHDPHGPAEGLRRLHHDPDVLDRQAALFI